MCVFIIHNEWNIFDDPGSEIIDVFHSRDEAIRYCEEVLIPKRKKSLEGEWPTYTFTVEKSNIDGWIISSTDGEIYDEYWVAQYDVKNY